MNLTSQEAEALKAFTGDEDVITAAADALAKFIASFGPEDAIKLLRDQIREAIPTEQCDVHRAWLGVCSEELDVLRQQIAEGRTLMGFVSRFEG